MLQRDHESISQNSTLNYFTSFCIITWSPCIYFICGNWSGWLMKTRKATKTLRVESYNARHYGSNPISYRPVRVPQEEQSHGFLLGGHRKDAQVSHVHLPGAVFQQHDTAANWKAGCISTRTSNALMHINGLQGLQRAYFIVFLYITYFYI